MSTGIRDKVVVLGMGCSKFGEHWDKGPEDLLVEAAYEAYESAGVDPNDIDMLQDLLIAAVKEAIERSQAYAAEKLQGLTGGLGIPGF